MLLPILGKYIYYQLPESITDKGGDGMTITLEDLFYIVSIVSIIIAFINGNKK